MAKSVDRPDYKPLEEIEPANARALAEAAVECFATKGFHATTTRDISAQAGLSPAAVYVHFSSKSELLYRISMVGHEEALKALEGAAAGQEDRVGRIRAATAGFAAWHARNPDLARVVQYEFDALPAEAHAVVLAIRRRFRSFFEAEIRAAAKEGLLTIEDIAGATLAILSLCIDVARWYDRGRGRSPGELGELYGELMLRMLGAAVTR